MADVKLTAAHSLSGARYDGAAYDSKSLEGWNVGLAAPEPAQARRDRDTLVARARDLARNDEYAKGALDRQVANVIGPGWGLISEINFKALGLSIDAAMELNDRIECLWLVDTQDPRHLFCYEGTRSFGQIKSHLFETFMTDGEALALLPFDDLGGRLPLGLKVQLISTDRVSNPHDRMDTETLRRGVEMTPEGRELGLHLRAAHPKDFTARGTRNHWDYYDNLTELGLPAYTFPRERHQPGQVRGVTRFAPVIRQIRHIHAFNDAELQAKTVNALFAGFIETNYDFATASNSLVPSEISEASAQRVDFYETYGGPKNPLGGRVPILPAGDSFKGFDTRRDSGEAFVGRSLHGIASALGLTYEQLTMDWSETNYSSARAALLEIWRGQKKIMADFETHVLRQIYFCWMAEKFETGKIVPPAGTPDIFEAPAAWLSCQWLKPARGWVDPEKEAKAARMRMGIGVSDPYSEAADQGQDLNRIYANIARAKAERERLGLSDDDFVVGADIPLGSGVKTPDGTAEQESET